MSHKDDVIALLLRQPEPDDTLLYMGEPVDATWPVEALLAMIHQLTTSARYQHEARSRSRAVLMGHK